MKTVIYHNPACGTSRNVLRLLEAADQAPIVIEYLKDGFSRAMLLGLFAAADVTPQQALRRKGAPPQALDLLPENASDDQIIAAMVAYPILVNRPFVCTRKGVKLCRPSELALDLLDTWPKGPFAKEDGALLIDDNGRRVG